MARHIDRKEFALADFETMGGGGAGGSMFAPGPRSVRRQGGVRRIVPSAVCSAPRFGGWKPVVEDALRIVQQTGKQRGFSVIHRAADDELQVRSCTAGGEKGIDTRWRRVTAPLANAGTIPLFPHVFHGNDPVVIDMPVFANRAADWHRVCHDLPNRTSTRRRMAPATRRPQFDTRFGHVRVVQKTPQGRQGAPRLERGGERPGPRSRGCSAAAPP